MNIELTKGNIAKSLCIFAGPMILGNLLQQVYSLVDTFIVGQYLGEGALAAVGGTYTLTTFLYSVIIGFCMGCGALVSYAYGQNNRVKMKQYMEMSFIITGVLTLFIEALTLLLCRPILKLLQIPGNILKITEEYTMIILLGILFIFLYNYYGNVLRAMGDSMMPLIFLGIASVLNIILDVWFVVGLHMGVGGAAIATVIAQGVAGIGLMLYSLWKVPETHWKRCKNPEEKLDKGLFLEVLNQSGASSLQQSVMNFGILMIQGLVNSFGTVVMAAFAVAVKIDTIAYMPAQEFGNAFSLFVSQNYGAGQKERIREGVKKAFLYSGIVCALISVLVFFFAKELMGIFVYKEAVDVIAVGIQYLRIEGVCYIGIGFLFLFYGYFRGMHQPQVSLLLTIISLGTRVLLAYILVGIVGTGVSGIWIAIPIGWALADVTGWKLLRRGS